MLIDLCREIAARLEVPLSRISVEMVLHGVYHFQVAKERGYAADAVTYFCDPANRNLGILKRERPSRQRSPTINL